MRRLPRILLNAMTSASLALCVATVALWVRSYRTADHVFDVRTPGGRYDGTDFAVTWRGRLVLRSARLDAPMPAGNDRKSHRPGHRTLSPADVAELAAPAELTPRAGFAWARYRYQAEPGFPASSGTMRVAVIPLYAVTLAFAVGPLLRLRAAIRSWRARITPGLCPTCGYDLRATPHRCPECGTPAR